MLDTGKDADWSSSPAIVCRDTGGDHRLRRLGDLGIERREPHRRDSFDLPLAQLRSRNGGGVLVLAYALFFGANLLQPLWLQTHMGYIATWAGLVAAPSGVVAVFLTPFVARLMNRVDARWTASISLSAFAASFFMRSGYTPDVSFGALVMPMLVQGVAMSTFFVSMITLSLNGIDGPKIPSASGLSNFARITAGSFAASLVTTVWDRGETLHQTRLAETMASVDPAWP